MSRVAVTDVLLELPARGLPGVSFRRVGAGGRFQVGLTRTQRRGVRRCRLFQLGARSR